MKKYIKTIALLFFAGITTAMAQNTATENRYRFSVNLKQVQNDQLQVKLKTPAISQPEIIYNLPKIVPGTYRIYDFGQYVEDFKALDKKGKELPVERLDKNRWKIKNATQLAQLIYNVNDTWDAEGQGEKVFEPAGTSIDAGNYFMINSHGFFGYFDDLKRVPFELTITKPQDFYGSTPLIATSTTDSTDTFMIDSYMDLADSPLMYNRPDTTILKVGNTDVLVSLIEPSKTLNSTFIAENIKEILEAQRKYLGGTLPVNKYAFLIYLVPEPKPGGYGALEHSFSSVYYMPLLPKDKLANMLRSTAAHEFFHILTPLTIHAKQIHDFDYINPQMSEHLWLYEGVTEYFATHVQAYENLFSPEDLLKKLREYVFVSKNYFNDTLPFTDMSRHVLTDYPDQYQNVYNKGALIGLALDIQLRKLSGGSYGLRNLMLDLSENYGKNKAFQDDELFTSIGRLTYPEVTTFLQQYVDGKQPLPLETIFNEVGVEYKPFKKEQTLTMGQINIGVNPDTKQVFIVSTDKMNDFGIMMGYRQNDILKKINGDKVKPDNLNALLAEHIKNAEAGDKLKVEVERDGKKVKMKGRLQPVESGKPHYLEFMPNPTPQQLKLRNAWLNLAAN